MLIREAKYEEKDILNKLFQNLLEHERDNYDDLIRDDVKIDSYFDIHLKNDNEIVLVAEELTEIIGYIHIIIDDDNKIMKDKIALINSLFVKEEYRNNHIGKSLIEEIIAKLKDLNIHNIEIDNIIANKEASHLYESLGFKEYKVNRRLKI